MKKRTPRKRTYAQPRVTDYGSVADLTTVLTPAGGASSTDICSSDEHDWCHINV